MHCYKCKSTEDLSVKKYDKYDNATYMCKECRRSERKIPILKSELDKRDEWNLKALENYHRISEKYATLVK